MDVCSRRGSASVAVATAPIVYRANAQIVLAQDRMVGSLLDVLA